MKTAYDAITDLTITKNGNETTYTRAGQSVTKIGAMEATHYNGQPCYRVYLRGDLDFFGSGILAVEERPDCTVVWYRPQDEHFVGFARQMEEIGAW
jgi:hypothetical protein